MNLRTITPIILMLFCLAGCQGSQKPEEAADSVSDPAPMAKVAGSPETGGPDVAPPGTDRKLIQNATLRFRVDKLANSEARTLKLVNQHGGTVTQSEESRSNGLLELRMTIRIPAGRLDAFLAEAIKESIYTDTKTITAEDVTRQYADTEARLRSKKAAEARYLDLLQKARSVQEVMAVEEQLRQIREEIEAQDAVFRALKNDVAQSTVFLTMYERGGETAEPGSPFYIQIVRNLGDGLAFVGQFIIGAFYFLPILLLAGAVWWGIRRWRKRA